MADKEPRTLSDLLRERQAEGVPIGDRRLVPDGDRLVYTDQQRQHRTPASRQVMPTPDERISDE